MPEVLMLATFAAAAVVTAAVAWAELTAARAPKSTAMPDSAAAPADTSRRRAA